MQHNFDIYRQAITGLNPNITDEEWDYFQSGLTVQTFKPREFYIEAGKKTHQLGFLISGLIRVYFINHLGEDITISFVKENEYATDYTSLITQTPSKYNFQCLEPGIIISQPYAHIQKGYDRYIGFERYGRLIAEEVLKMQQKRIESFQFDNAEQRYLNFIKQNPDLFNRISLTHLSSYLGIERPSLSRIRKKIVGL
ncbi:cAMP-binding domain of CRP or a regulatory subunit of cAMP-dependent protein kinases [Mucilaginibacter mallensis]|uniref:cAMP-binding domain of CRP or a regulatory subunit of cAMP-dependent protein kinases n=1 Tax=Mucilaginibacter mallensis TaxID=652787 RepID=A0A1H2AQK1_MUCMA|nr:Crp/Fnr family transcriptional regulator [Mucilaginibacter mallensis]SDT48240.1 cAMP-binding domain of CRP or a regulatory subunit of cAMP-dependent protein kinases [Mucilaginibacter mallensis]